MNAEPTPTQSGQAQDPPPENLLPQHDPKPEPLPDPPPLPRPEEEREER